MKFRIFILLIFLSASYWLLHLPTAESAQPEPPQVRVVPTVSTLDLSREAVSSGYTWPVGAQQTYEVQQSSKSVPIADAFFQIPEMQATHRISLTVLAVDAASVLLCGQCYAVKWESNGKMEPEREAMYLQNPCLLRWSLDGALIEVQTPLASGPQDEAELLQFWRGLEWVFLRENQWSSQEQHSAGTIVRSQYQNQGGLAFTKSRHVVPQEWKNNEILQPNIIHSTGEAQANDGSGWWLHHAALMETIALVDRSQTPAAISDLKWEVNLDPNAIYQKPALNETQWDSPLVQTARAESSAQAKIDGRIRREKFADLPLETVLGNLVSVIDGDEAYEKSIAPLFDLADWLEVHPEQAHQIVAWNKTLSEGVSSRVAHALALAGRSTQSCQDALSAIWSDPQNTFAQRVQAGSAIADVGVIKTPNLKQMVADILRPSDPTFGLSDSDDIDTLDSAQLTAVGRLAQTDASVREQLIEASTPEMKDPTNPRFPQWQAAMQAAGLSHNN